MKYMEKTYYLRIADSSEYMKVCHMAFFMMKMTYFWVNTAHPNL